jgi:hypothetical protein
MHVRYLVSLFISVCVRKHNDGLYHSELVRILRRIKQWRFYSDEVHEAAPLYIQGDTRHTYWFMQCLIWYDE